MNTGATRLSARLRAKKSPKVDPEIQLDNQFSSLEITDSQGCKMQSSQEIIHKYLVESEEETLSDDNADVEDEGGNKASTSPDDQAGRAASLEFTQAQVDDLRNENQILRECLSELELEMLRNRYAITKVEGRQDKLDSMIKRKNIIVEGLEETRRSLESPDDVVNRLFKEIGVNRPLNYDQAYRIGTYNDRKKRPFLISFQKQEDRDYVFALRANLAKSDNFYNVWLVDDVTPNARRTKTIIRQINKAAKEAGAKCTSTAFSLTIDHQKYEALNFDTLPEQFSLEKVKTKQITDSLIAYHSEHSPFSNLFPCAIRIAKREFTSLEQLFQFKRAKRHNRSDLAEKIYLSRDAYEIRQFGAEAGSSEEWKKIEQDVMLAIMLRKFQQNPDLRRKLLATGDKTLVEATPDKFWGAGVSLTSRALKEGSYPGGNRQGKLLMKARATIRLESGTENHH